MAGGIRDIEFIAQGQQLIHGGKKPTIRDYNTWTDIDLATAAFGQGVSATPLQVLNGFNVIANGGFLLQPKVISQIIDEKIIAKIIFLKYFLAQFTVKILNITSSFTLAMTRP